MTFIYEVCDPYHYISKACHSYRVFFYMLLDTISRSMGAFWLASTAKFLDTNQYIFVHYKGLTQASEFTYPSASAFTLEYSTQRFQIQINMNYVT